MARRRRDAASALFATLAFAAIAGLAGCAGQERGSGAEGSGAERENVPLGVGRPEATPLADLPRETRALAPRELLAPAWPSDFRQVDEGALGPEALPVVWFGLETERSPLEALRAAMETLEPLAGPLRVRSVAASEELVAGLAPGGDEELAELVGPGRTPGGAVGQLAGTRLRAGLEATRRGDLSVVRVTIELLPEGAVPAPRPLPGPEAEEEAEPEAAAEEAGAPLAAESGETAAEPPPVTSAEKAPAAPEGASDEASAASGEPPRG